MTISEYVQKHDRLASVARRVSGAGKSARTGAATLIERAPGTMDTARAGAVATASALQTLPDPTLRWLAGSSVGLGAGFYLARAPRLIVAAAVAPALIIGAAIALRPKTVVPVEAMN
jgi:hypothetical protein